MKRMLWVSVAAITVFALSLNAIAQPGGQGAQGPRQGGGAFGQMGGATTPAQLLRNAEVVKMLTLTESQTTALNEVFPQRGQGAGGGQGRGADGGQGVPRAQGQGGAGGAMTAEQRAEMETRQAQRTTAMWAGINRVLNAEQQTKFKEIYFQANNGMNAMQLDAWMLAAVNLTPQQKEAIDKLVADRRAAAPQGGPGGGQQMTQEERQAQRTAMQERNEKFVADVNAVLTTEQKAKAQTLTEGAAALRTTLGIPAAGQGGQRGQSGQGGGGAGGGGGFVPGQGAWQPGQGAPTGGGQRQGAGGRQRGGAGGGN